MLINRIPLQEDDGIPAAAELLEQPYMPENSKAGPLPHKEDPGSARYGTAPTSTPPQNPPANQGVSIPLTTNTL